MVGTLAFATAAWFSPITWIAGMGLLGLYTVFMMQAIRAAQAHRRCLADERDTNGGLDLEGVDPGAPWPKILFYLALGIIGLPLGADILVKAATAIARTYHVSETVIGLTLVALLEHLFPNLPQPLRRQCADRQMWRLAMSSAQTWRICWQSLAYPACLAISP